MTKPKLEKGFTLTELLVSMTIIAVMIAIFLANYRAGERLFALQNAAHKLAQDFRRVEEMAMSARETSGGGIPSGGYGIYFDANEPDHYILFADEDGREDYDSPSELIEDIVIDKKEMVEIKNLIHSFCPSGTCANAVAIFMPPDPEVTMKVFWLGGSWIPVDSLTVELTNNYKTQKVYINEAGLIHLID
jgi:prepilin-type N-terminal cleavage/methylation domain-containing protein